MKEWLTIKEIAEMLNTTERKVQDAVRTLRRIGAVETTPDPRDERFILVRSTGLEVIRRALLLNDGTQTA